MLRRQHKVDNQHHDIPLIYYMEGHNLHFGRREFSLITVFHFGTVSFDLHSSCELKFQNRVFPNKIGFGITNLDIISVIEDEEMFGKLSDDDAICLCLLLSLEESRSTSDLQPTIAEHQSSWWIDNNLYFQEFVPRAPPIKEHHGLFETYLSKLEKARKRRKTGFMVSSIGGTTDNIVRKKWLNNLVIMELNFRLFILETIIQVLAHERSDRQAKLKFTDEFSSMTSELCDSLNIMFANLIKPADPDEDIAQEGEEKMRSEHQKLIVEENKIWLDEAERLRLEEKNMLQLEQQKKNKRKEFMNSSHCKNLLSKLAHAKRIQLCSSSEKIKPTVSWVKIKKYRQQVYDPCTAEFLKNVKPWVESIYTVWWSDDIEHILGQSWQIKCKFPWNDDYIVDRNFWLKLVCLDAARKGWLTEELNTAYPIPLNTAYPVLCPITGRTCQSNDIEIELNKKFWVELRKNIYQGTYNEDVVEHIAKVLNLVDLIYVPGVDSHQLRMKVFPLSLADDAKEWWISEGDGKITT
ncbi:hypothetical protein Tco_1458097 [Tanacetum coccineum]